MTDQSKSVGFDFSELTALDQAAEEGRWCELLHPATKLPTGVRFLVVGVGSPRYKEAWRAAHTRAINHASEGKELTEKEILEQAAQAAAHLLVGWENVRVNGELVEFSEQAAFELFVKFPRARQQVDKFSDDLRNFTKT